MRIALLSLTPLAVTVVACGETTVEPPLSAAVGTYTLAELDGVTVPALYRETDWPCSTSGGGLLGCYCPAEAMPFDTVMSGSLQVQADGEFTIEWIVQPTQSTPPATATCTVTTGWWTETATGLLRLSNAICFIDGCYGPRESVRASDYEWGVGTALVITGVNGLNAGLRGRFVKD